MSCSNTTFLPRPSGADCFTNAGSACSAGSPFSCCDADRLTPRRKRAKVRDQMRDAVLMELGAPRVKLELDEQQIDYAVDFALKVIEDYAPREFFDYYTFYTTPGKSVYELPPDVGHVRNVYYRETPNIGFSANDLGGVIPVEYFYPGGAISSGGAGIFNPTQPIWGNMGEFTLYNMYSEMYSRVSSSLGGWEWVGGYRHIKLFPIPCGSQPVIVHYLQRCKDWDCLSQAMVEGAVAKAKQMLGRIRSRFQGSFGPGGGMQLDGATLVQEGKDEWDKFEQRLLDRYGDLLGPSYG
jgi:hypothetical protein